MDPVISLSAPIMVDFEVTNSCPYRCFFCEGDIPKNKKVEQLDTSGCIQVLEKISNSGVLNVFFTGGEPLLREDLPLLIKTAYSFGLEPSVSTTLYPLNPKKLEKLVDSGLKNIQVSMQGIEHIHNDIVGRQSSYSRVVNNLKQLLKTDIRVDIASVGLKENLPYIPDFIREIGRLGIKYFRLLRFVPSHGKDQLDHIPSRQSVEKYMMEIRKASEESSVSFLLSFCPGLSSNFPSYLFESVHPSTQTCPAGKTEFTITPNGDTYPCVSLKGSLEFRTGNILENTVSEIWNHPAMKMMRELTPADYNGSCGECERKWTCYSARCVAYNLTGDVKGDDLSCYLIREELNQK